jgi:hypothetical protein
MMCAPALVPKVVPGREAMRPDPTGSMRRRFEVMRSVRMNRARIHARVDGCGPRPVALHDQSNPWDRRRIRATTNTEFSGAGALRT